MGIVEYLGAGDAGAQSNAKGAGCRCAGWGLVAMWAGSSQLSLTQHGFCRWQGCECLHAGTSGGACTMHAALPAHAILTHPAAAATNVTQQAAATANNRRRCAASDSAHCCFDRPWQLCRCHASWRPAADDCCAPGTGRHTPRMPLIPGCAPTCVRRLRAEKAPATNFNVAVTTPNATLASQVEVGAAAGSGAAASWQCTAVPCMVGPTPLLHTVGCSPPAGSTAVALTLLLNKAVASVTHQPNCRRG